MLPPIEEEPSSPFVEPKPGPPPPGTYTRATLNERSAGDLLDVVETRIHNANAERQALWLAINSPEEGPLMLDKSRAHFFDNPARKTLLLILQDMFLAGSSIHFEAVQLRMHTQVPTASLPAMSMELEAVMEMRTELTTGEILGVLETCYRSRTVHRRIFQEGQRRFLKNESIDLIIDDISSLLLTMDPQMLEQESTYEVMCQVIDDVLNPKPHKRGLITGLDLLDLQFGGIRRDRVWVIGGGSGTGKTAIMVDLICRLLRRYALPNLELPDTPQVAIKYYSLEMSNYRIMQRCLARTAFMSVYRQENHGYMGNLSIQESEVKRVLQQKEDWRNWAPSLKVEYRSLSAKEMKIDAQRFALLPENKGKHLIFMIDHLGLAEKEGDDNRLEFDRLMVASKDIARDLNATVFPLVQLKKEVESDNNRKNYFKPNNSHLMESIGVKATADNLTLLWRPGAWEDFATIPYGDTNTYETLDKIWYLTGKNRDGAAGNESIFKCDIEHNHVANLIPSSFGGKAPF